MRNTVNELQPAIGASVAVRFESITVHCTVLDAKNSYGQVRLLVSPLSGSGSQWIELSRIRASVSHSLGQKLSNRNEENTHAI